jgi:hypothetical protein
MPIPAYAAVRQSVVSRVGQVSGGWAMPSAKPR